MNYNHFALDHADAVDMSVPLWHGLRELTSEEPELVAGGFNWASLDVAVLVGAATGVALGAAAGPAGLSVRAATGAMAVIPAARNGSGWHYKNKLVRSWGTVLRVARQRVLRLIAATVAVSSIGLLLTATPASAVRGLPCDGKVIDQAPGWSGVSYDIVVNRKRYGRFNIGVLNTSDDIRGRFHYVLRVAVEDLEPDGKPPYVFLGVKTKLPVRSFTTPKFHSYQSSAPISGRYWECHSRAGEGNITQVKIYGSVDNAPSIPEELIVTWGPGPG